METSFLSSPTVVSIDPAKNAQKGCPFRRDIIDFLNIRHCRKDTMKFKKRHHYCQDVLSDETPSK